jgi:biotin--protein ligase
VDILVYQDQGADADCVQQSITSLKAVFPESDYSIRTVDSNFLNQTSWEKNTFLLVMPGGRSLPYYEKLAPSGNKKIIDYVQNGGCYLGICAGAYYASATTEFAKNQPLEVVCHGPLNFFSGIARGPVYHDEVFSYEKHGGAKLAKISYLCNQPIQIYSMYYHGGCHFVTAEQYANVEVIARYEDLAEKPAAIIRCQVDKGIAILSGVHIEYSYRGIDERYAKPLAEALSEVENVRQQLFANVLSGLIKL